MAKIIFKEPKDIIKKSQIKINNYKTYFKYSVVLNIITIIYIIIDKI